MGKSVHNDVLDAALNEIINNCDKMTLCEGEPTTYSQANTLKSSGGKKLGEEAMLVGDFGGPSDGDTSGRKLTVSAQSGVSIDEAGDWDHIALLDTGGSRLLHVTSRSGGSVAVTASGTANVSAYDQEIEDPA